MPHAMDGFRGGFPGPLGWITYSEWLRGPLPSVEERRRDLMGFVKTLVKGAVVAKLLQVAQRELSKPENQRKAKEMFQKVQQRRGAH